MPEATIICVDSSDYMRNGDYFPSRMSGAQEACTILINAKMGANPENTVGFLTMGGKACSVRETLTADVDRLMASAVTIPVGGQLHFAHGIQIAQLALSHRINRRHEARIVAFVGSPVLEAPKELEKLAKRLRKDGVAIDIIAFGVDENVELLDRFVATADKDNNSHFINVPVGSNIVHATLSGTTGGDGGGGGAMDFSETGGVDPSMDPELAMVIRMSLEEERDRQARAANAERASAADAAGAAAPPATTAGTSAPASAAAAPAATTSAPSAAAAEDRELTEEEQLEMALKLSMEEAEADAVRDAPPAAGGDAAPDAAFAEAIQDEEFLRQLKEDADNAGGDDVTDADKK